MTFRSPKYLAAARDQPCMRCGKNDGTTVACHYFGIFRHALGGGMGHKVPDFCTADLCAACHIHFDSYVTSNDYARAAEFLSYCLRTVGRRLEQGILQCKGTKPC